MDENCSNILLKTSCKRDPFEPPRGKQTMWFPNRSDTNWPVQVQKRARSLKFRILEGEEVYYPCSENKGADQLRGYREADLRLCFRICRLLVFSRGGSFIITKTGLCSDFFSFRNLTSHSKKFDVFYLLLTIIHTHNEAILTSTHNLCLGAKIRKQGVPL